MERPGSAAVPGRCGAQQGHGACSRGPARSKAHDVRERVPPMRDVIRGHDFVPSGTPCPSARPWPRGHAPAHPIRSRNGRAQHFPNYTPCETRRRSDTVTACEHVHSFTSCPPNPNPCREPDHRLGVGEPRVLGLSKQRRLPPNSRAGWHSSKPNPEPARGCNSAWTRCDRARREPLQQRCRPILPKLPMQGSAKAAWEGLRAFMDSTHVVA